MHWVCEGEHSQRAIVVKLNEREWRDEWRKERVARQIHVRDGGEGKGRLQRGDMRQVVSQSSRAVSEVSIREAKGVVSCSGKETGARIATESRIECARA